MFPIARFLALGAGIFGGLVLSQAPEMTQQYAQRIGGALDELRVIVETFDQQAAENKLDRDKALTLYSASGEPFLRSQGASMQQTITRYETLEAQSEALSTALPVLKPFVLIREADSAILGNAWRDFIPAVPISIPGLVWAAIGFISGWALLRVLAFLSRAAYRLGAGRRYRLLH
ncbi:DUF2937 family protein [Pararhizobium antarcticum]|uniref:DUF2937 domain-containing protein n=1 Tax=Pararhizobium antarcticum TaxID=1798805 RepID=A0A657LYU1_9HYPH|nr:DUF2937 family protein [Pararhizobium antarcticum]OJF90371.1 hypothetical protein AX761_06790 [Rhizobium sp. 58]OJG00567.1 hypothetical protein AX760_10400 [Pararhizobium antarcticum]